MNHAYCKHKDKTKKIKNKKLKSYFSKKISKKIILGVNTNLPNVNLMLPPY